MYIKNTECDVSKMEESIIVMKKNDNSLHILNETASVIWEQIEKASVNDIINLIMSKYIDVSIEVVTQDVDRTINSLVEKGLLVLC